MTNNQIRTILERWQRGEIPQAGELKILSELELIDRHRCDCFGITTDNIAEVIENRSLLFRALIPDLDQWPIKSTNLLENLWLLWLPIAQKIVTKKANLDQPLIQGILGGQGTGKSTLGKILTIILAKLSLNVVTLSIDDLYKTYADRLLLQKQDARLIWRGPPGTHDIELALEVIAKIRLNYQSNLSSSIAIPRFDKSLHGGQGDRVQPEIINQKIDIFLLEGWLVGIRPIEPILFNNPLPPIITESDRQFALDMNAKLADYLPLWDCLDSLIILLPEDYRLSQTWRWQAEQEAIAQGKGGMTETAIKEFVQYFWKALHPELFMPPLIKHPIVDLVISINNEQGDRIYQIK